jgi:hypothetical protein
MKLDSPTKRFGSLVMLVSLAGIALLLLGYWNGNKWPIYKDTLTKYDPATTVWISTMPFNAICLEKHTNGQDLNSLSTGDRLKALSECDALPIEKTTVWHSSMRETLAFVSKNPFANVLMLGAVVGLILVSGLFENVLNWVKHGQKPKQNLIQQSDEKNINTETKKVPSMIKRWIWAALMVLGWLAFYISIKNSGVVLGGIPWAVLFLVWLHLFSKVTGINLGFKKQ